MGIKNIVVFKEGVRPHNEMWYLQQVLDSIGLKLSMLEGAHLDIRYIDHSSLNQSFVVGFAMQSGYDIDKCTLTPFADRDGGEGMVLKVLG
jgi:hypothetical protein